MSVHAMSWVWEHSEVKLAARLVLLSLADHAKSDGTAAWPSVDTLAEHTRLSRSAVQRNLRALEKAGAIAATGRSKSGTVVYDVLMGGPQDAAPGARGGPLSAQGGGRAARPEPSGTTTTADGQLALSASLRGSSCEPSHDSEKETIRRLFAFWKERTGRNGRTRLTDGRRDKLSTRLKNYDEQEIMQAIANVAASDFHRIRGFTELTMICGSDDKLEHYRDMDNAPLVEPRKGTRLHGVSAKAYCEEYGEDAVAEDGLVLKGPYAE